MWTTPVLDLENVRHDLQCQWLTARRNGDRAEMNRLEKAIQEIEAAQQTLATA